MRKFAVITVVGFVLLFEPFFTSSAVNAAVSNTTALVASCDQCTYSQHIQRARSKAMDGTVVRVYSMDMPQERLYAFDVTVESEPGLRLVFAAEVPLPQAIVDDWAQLRVLEAERRALAATGIDFTHESLLENLATLQGELNLSYRVRLHLQSDTFQRFLTTLQQTIDRGNVLFFQGPPGVRHVQIHVVFSDGSRDYEVEWGVNQFGEPVVVDIDVLPNTTVDIAGNIIPDTLALMNQALDQGGFILIGPMDKIQNLLTRFFGSGGAIGGLTVRLLSGTVTVGAVEVVRSNEDE
jgi:hypothetical protein